MEFTVAEPWFSLLVAGRKTVEGRLNRPKYKSLAVGTVLTFWNPDRTRSCTRVLMGVAAYRSFADMLDAEGLERVLPGIATLEGGVAIYRQFYSAEEEQQTGVLALSL